MVFRFEARLPCGVFSGVSIGVRQSFEYSAVSHRKLQSGADFSESSNLLV